PPGRGTRRAGDLASRSSRSVSRGLGGHPGPRPLDRRVPGASRLPSAHYLFTTLVDHQTYAAEALAQLYGQRWQIELCLRYIKAQMDLGFLECHSADMVRKEWLSGLIAYNIIRWCIAGAAALAQIPVQVLSFSRARELLLGWCIRWSVRRPSLHSWKLLLNRIGKARL